MQKEGALQATECGILHKRYLGREIDTSSRKLGEVAGSSNIRKCLENCETGGKK